MADLTLKLIWYRLNESCLSMASTLFGLLAEADVLNVLLLGWMLFTGLVFSLVTFYQRAAEAQKKRLPAPPVHDSAASPSGGGDSLPPQPRSLSPAAGSHWVTDVASWLRAHCPGAPENLPSILQALSEESRGLGDDVLISFDSLLSGSMLPNIAAVAAGASVSPTLVLNAAAEFRDLRFAIHVSHRTPAGPASQLPQPTILVVTKLNGKVSVQLSHSKGDGLSAVTRFDEDATMQIELEGSCDATSGTMNRGSGVNSSNGSSSSNSSSKLSSRLMVSSTRVREHIARVLRGVTLKVRIPVLVCEMQPIGSASSGPPKPPRTPPKPEATSEGRLQLMIKLRKATGLGAPNAGNTSPYCKVELDYPSQAYTTSVAQNTVNPYWDEHFVFHISLGSKAIKFSIFDKEKKAPDDFLGQACLDLDRVRATNPGCIQVLPLAEGTVECGRPAPCVSGSITVEMQFMEMAPDYTELRGHSLSPPLTQSTPNNSDIGSTLGLLQQRLQAVPAQRGAQQPLAAQTDVTDRLNGRVSAVERPTTAAGLLQRSRSSILHVENSADSSAQDWSPDGDAPAFVADDAAASIGRSDTDLFHSIDFSNAEVVIVSCEQMAEAAVKELRRQLGRPCTSGSRTSTVVITSVHKEPIVKVGDEQFGRCPDYGGSAAAVERVPSEGTNNTAESKERKSRLSAFKRHFSKSKDKKARSHSIERSTNIDSSLKPPPSPDKIHGKITVTANESLDLWESKSRRSSGSNVRKLFTGGKRSDGRASRSHRRAAGSLPRLSDFESHLQSTSTLATAVVMASGSSCTERACVE